MVKTKNKKVVKLNQLLSDLEECENNLTKKDKSAFLALKKYFKLKSKIDKLD